MKILLADDQEILLMGLKFFFEQDPQVTWVKTASNGEEAISMADQWNPDIIVMDIQMPLLDGVEASRRIKSRYPKMKILILTTFVDNVYIHEAIKYGADGYLLKDTPPKEILAGVKKILDGGAFISPDVASVVLASMSKHLNDQIDEVNPLLEDLTRREYEVVALVSEGYSNKEIADILAVAEGTVKNHITKILLKLEVRDRTQLAIFGVKNKVKYD